MELMNGASQHTNVLTFTMTMYHFWLYADIDDVMDYIKAKNNVTNA